MKIETKINLKFKNVEVDLTIEEAKELKAKLDQILAEPAPIYIKNYPWGWPTIQYPYYYNGQLVNPTIFTPIITCDSTAIGGLTTVSSSSTNLDHPNNNCFTLTGSYNK